jgi:DNA-binding transcriptional MerR regulator
VPDHDVIDIAELGHLTDSAPSALRYYERLGLLSPTGRADAVNTRRAPPSA